MPLLKTLVFISLFSATLSLAFANGCCKQMGGVSYCDSSAGRLVCQNGFYSTCYCTRHAVMDLQLFKGCCLWHGGVLPTFDNTGLVVCNDGAISEECSLQSPTQSVSTW